jgi:hypothetical protein
MTVVVGGGGGHLKRQTLDNSGFLWFGGRGGTMPSYLKLTRQSLAFQCHQRSSHGISSFLVLYIITMLRYLILQHMHVVSSSFHRLRIERSVLFSLL